MLLIYVYILKLNSPCVFVMFEILVMEAKGVGGEGRVLVRNISIALEVRIAIGSIGKGRCFRVGVDCVNKQNVDRV